MPTLRHRDLTFYYETAGNPAAPALLIIAGITDYTAKCDWQAAGLAGDYYVITFDNRGAGRSSVPPPGYTIGDMADDAAAVLDALSVESAHVFGFSMGGMIALNLALRHPERVRRLVLGCTTAGGRLAVPPDEQIRQTMLNPARPDDRRQAFLDGVWVSVSERCVAEQPEVIGQLADLAAGNPQTPAGYAGQLQAVLSHDVANSLGEISAPTLVMHGEADRLIPVENGRLLANHIPGARLILYPGAGHLFFIERADEVNRDIRAFLREGEPVEERGDD